MHIGLKITLGVLGAGALFGIGYAIHRSIRSKKEDDLTVDIGNVDWVNKKVPYSVKLNGRAQKSGTATWSTNFNVPLGSIFNHDKNKVTETSLPNGLVITASSLGTDKDAKIIDFNSKTVKPFKGNVSNAIAGATQTLTNLFG